MKYEDYSILNTIAAAAADRTLSQGKLSVTGLGEAIPVRSIVEARKATFSAGTASDKTYDLSGFTLEADSVYTLEVSVPGILNDGSHRNERPQLHTKRAYPVTLDTAPTAARLVDLLVAAVNGDGQSKVTATDGGNSIQLVLDSVAQGDFYVKFTKDNVEVAISETVNTAFAAAQGSPALLNADLNNDDDISGAGSYTRYEIEYIVNRNTQQVNGGIVGRKKRVAIFLEEGATNYAALVTGLDAVFNGTYTPASDYHAVPFA